MFAYTLGGEVHMLLLKWTFILLKDGPQRANRSKLVGSNLVGGTVIGGFVGVAVVGRLIGG